MNVCYRLIFILFFIPAMYTSVANLKREVLLALWDVGAIKFGNFTLKSGIQSPIYIDLRCIYSHPLLLQKIVRMISKKIETVSCDRVTGVPCAAIPYATIFSCQTLIPLVLVRTEIKNHGTKKCIEGEYQKGDRVLVLDDLITSGTSILKVYETLVKERLQITDVVVFLDRQQGGIKCLQQKGVTVHSVCTITELLEVLLQEHKITYALYDEVRNFLLQNTLVV